MTVEGLPPRPVGRSATDPTPNTADTVLRAAARLLRPLVRLLIRSGITFPVLTDMLRGLYVDVACQDELSPEARTDSRITLLTGVHRKEVRRLRLLGDRDTVIPPAVSLGSQVIARWLGGRAYVDRRGRPRSLPRSAPAGVASFDSLVASITTDIRPRAVLDGLLGQSAVTIDARDRVHLDAKAYLPNPGSEAQMYYFSRNLRDHIAAASANVVALGAPPFLERAVHYDRLSPAISACLADRASAAGQEMLMTINRVALELLDEEESAGLAKPQTTPTQRLNFGVYLFIEDESVKEG